ncbi:efflux RND transporter periplasmic adaptor subunit [Alteromonas sp. KUL49]|uniref:efflux RND transporter periplasmic adaptor subunit n=1 Tax=Alteromonas sp. KUL49 TaxID=2480798 RepID=UPI00102EEB9D|nr:efflux RND transporter periplasmic adaptor subunit [Alteromonas sp. KUL49]TAP42475.1 efflux RND transporter periplasmic adaptor subunit [Alteromonas sp. KUL49]GEA10098.1 hemolysin D [Alteromonas sp. KUL49]
MFALMQSVRSRLHKQPFWIAIVIVVAIIAWVASGSNATEASSQNSTTATQQDSVAKVRIEAMQAYPVNRDVSLYGRTEPDRMTTLRAEVKGTVVEVLALEGQFVKAGQPLVKLDGNDLSQRLRSARALLAQREIELEAATSLDQQGFQSKANLAGAKANVESAKATVEGLILAIENLVISAPYDGVLNERFVEVGDLLKDGDQVATVVDLDPLVVVADVTESYIHQLSIGQMASGRMVSGDVLKGTIRYISSTSNVGTNTFKIEVSVPNSDLSYMAGMSTELSIPLEQTWAVKITPAVMALDEQGNLGVKTVVDSRVRFVPIDVVKSDSEGVWLGGLGERADIITLGHGYVRDGDIVEASYADGSE